MTLDIDEADMDAVVASHHLAIDAGRNAPARVEAEFARARRHSRHVRLLKIGLPIVATLIFIGGGLAVWLARSLPDDVSVSAASIDKGRVVMQDPRMSGVDEQRPSVRTGRAAGHPVADRRPDRPRTGEGHVAIGDGARPTFPRRPAPTMRRPGRSGPHRRHRRRDDNGMSPSAQGCRHRPSSGKHAGPAAR